MNISILFHFYTTYIKREIRKGGRVVNCTNFENWRGFAVTVGSNPSLSDYNRVTFAPISHPHPPSGETGETEEIKLFNLYNFFLLII